MLWRRKKPSWPIDPEDVSFGSVVEGGDRNLSRTHVLVHFVGKQPRYMPVTVFIQEMTGRLAEGRSLGIRRLVVAPLTKRRNARFFDKLTDWASATRRALGNSGARARPRRDTSV